MQKVKSAKRVLGYHAGTEGRSGFEASRCRFRSWYQPAGLFPIRNRDKRNANTSPEKDMPVLSYKSDYILDLSPVQAINLDDPDPRERPDNKRL